MKKLGIVCILLLSGCGWRTETDIQAQNAASEIVSHEQFTSLDIAGPFSITYHKAPEYTMRITGDAQLLKLVEVNYLDSMTRIVLPKDINTDKQLFIDLSAPYLDAIYLSGATTSTFADLERDHITVRLAGAYTCTLSGKVHALAITASGAGKLDALALQAHRVTVEASGASDIAVFAEKELSVKAYGATHVRYAGTPEIYKELAGAGNVTAV